MNILVSQLDSVGNERMHYCYKRSLDDRGICNGITIVLHNDHKKNSWHIYKMAGSKYQHELAKGKDETLTQMEFKGWLNANGYANNGYLACKKALKVF